MEDQGRPLLFPKVWQVLGHICELHKWHLLREVENVAEKESTGEVTGSWAGRRGEGAVGIALGVGFP